MEFVATGSFSSFIASFNDDMCHFSTPEFTSGRSLFQPWNRTLFCSLTVVPDCAALVSKHHATLAYVLHLHTLDIAACRLQH